MATPTVDDASDEGLHGAWVGDVLSLALNQS